MKTSTLGRVVIAAALFSLTACGGERRAASPADGIANVLPPETDRAPQLHGTQQSPKLAITITDGQEVETYDYVTHAVLRQISVAYSGVLCSDKAGDVWVSSAGRNGSEMLEYPPGATQPSAALFSYPPAGCAVDPASGDLAVVTWGDARRKQNLEIYASARGLPKTYSYGPLKYWYYCAYDGNGNLVIQGYDRQNAVAYAELQKGHKNLVAVNISTTDGDVAGIQWDGKYFVVGYENDNTLYRYAVRRGQATQIGEIKLADPHEYMNGFGLHHDTLVAVLDAPESDTYVIAGFPYPAGSPQQYPYTPSIGTLTIAITERH